MSGYYSLRQLYSAREGTTQKAHTGLFPFSRSTLLNMVKRGEFPKPIKLGIYNAWPKEQVEAWCREREEAQKCTCECA